MKIYTAIIVINLLTMAAIWHWMVEPVLRSLALQ